jgi:hypothetical protein
VKDSSESAGIAPPILLCHSFVFITNPLVADTCNSEALRSVGFNLAETRASSSCVSAAGSVCRRQSAIKCTSPESETAWYALTVNCQGLQHKLRERVRLCPGTHINRLSSHQAFRDPANKASAIYSLPDVAGRARFRIRRVFA